MARRDPADNRRAETEGHYENTLELLPMIVMSGNWWPPDAAGELCSP